MGGLWCTFQLCLEHTSIYWEASWWTPREKTRHVSCVGDDWRTKRAQCDLWQLFYISWDWSGTPQEKHHIGWHSEAQNNLSCPQLCSQQGREKSFLRSLLSLSTQRFSHTYQRKTRMSSLWAHYTRLQRWAHGKTENQPSSLITTPIKEEWTSRQSNRYIQLREENRPQASCDIPQHHWHIIVQCVCHMVWAEPNLGGKQEELEEVLFGGAWKGPCVFLHAKATTPSPHTSFSSTGKGSAAVWACPWSRSHTRNQHAWTEEKEMQLLPRNEGLQNRDNLLQMWETHVQVPHTQSVLPLLWMQRLVYDMLQMNCVLWYSSENSD